MNTKEICAKDNILQRNGKFKTAEIRKIHEEYSKATNEEEEVLKLMQKYKKG